mmetsp:Transcript_1422/g.4252  ORF Transcript_1422/g.4252 Transcript_1422/m.4252 type:complete len:130 (-) Transcript_1422:202-591(-)
MMNGDPPTMGDPGEHYPKLAEWERQFAEQLAAKEAQEQKSLEEKKAAAERDLDLFYDELTDKKAQKQAQNREHEELLRSQYSTETLENPFERVLQLIGQSSGSVPQEMQIMHSLLVRLKQQAPKRPEDE